MTGGITSVLTMNLEITEHRKTEAALQESEANFVKNFLWAPKRPVEPGLSRR